ncbi:MAG: DnaK suppressor protein [Gammaproteobacteria bacterium]|nr:MAG: DnaK suppressor protein [Gammaproteobacteria bacterium]TND06906.1 MAG: DnaK suppressor protein [Gammaproteobacteria bacterium]
MSKATKKAVSAPKAKKAAPAAKTKTKSAAAPAKTRARITAAKQEPVKKPAAKPRTVAAKTATAAPAKPAAVPSGSTHEFTGFTPYKMKKGEEYMNKVQRQHFRAILMDWKMELMREVDRTMHHLQDDAANYPDPNDRATQESDFTLELRTRDRERKLIKKIDESLGNLGAGDYGYCEVCGVEIGIRRLEARPTAMQCIDCKTLDEIREKHLSG